MATLADLVSEHTDLEGPVVTHLQRLVAGWGVLSDLSFADLLLFVPVRDSLDSFVVVGQVRPTTNQTLHLDDLVGQVMGEADRPIVARAWSLGSVVEGEVAIPSRSESARLVCIPVRWQGQLVAIMTRESALTVGRRPGVLERVYIEVFDRLARMISHGEFPFPVDEPLVTEAPRVGDGVLVLDSSGRVDYASPNAVNALHRIGVYSGLEGVRLDEAGLQNSAVALAYQTHLPAVEEAGDGDMSVIIRCVPLLDQGSVTGSLVLLRDVSDIRRRDRLLLSKDAAIREVHHRVKNNLQTISSLLRIQYRRMPAGEARQALEESERRVRSIAVVHEILSRDTTDEVDFNDILPSLVRMAEDMGRPDRPLQITYRGEAGELQASVATPLAVVITELLQNAAEHAFPARHDEGELAYDSSGDAAHGTSGDAAHGTSGDAAHDTSGDAAHGTSGDAVHDTSGDAVHDTSGDAVHDTSGDAAQDTGAEATAAVGWAPEVKGSEEPNGGRRSGPLLVDIELDRSDEELRVTVRDNGVGLPDGFSVNGTSTLGLSIVRGLVIAQMGGAISMYNDGGTVVEMAIPVDHANEDLERL